jgi:hypothetical protein
MNKKIYWVWMIGISVRNSGLMRVSNSDRSTEDQHIE